jgi:oligoendopeptidase F
MNSLITRSRFPWLVARGSWLVGDGSWLVCAAVLLALSASGVAQERDRGKIPDKYKWNLADLYPSDVTWRAAKDRVAGELPALSAFKGRLAASPATLADALETMSRFDKELSRQYAYAHMLADQDTRDSGHEGMKQEMVRLFAALGAQGAYIEPEVIRFGQGTIEKFIAAEPRLKAYEFYLKDIARRAPHTLSEAEERLLADAGPLAGSPSNTYGIIANADLPYPTVTLGDGKAVKIDQAAYNSLRALPARADREKVMSAFFNTLGGFGRTFGTTMSGNVQKALFLSKTRKYPSTLEWSLNAANIPASVYTRLVDGVNRNLAVFHRYLNLRKRMLGVDELHYYDLYAPLVASMNLQYSPEEAQRLVLEATAPLGADYQAVLRRAYSERWIDFFPNEGKRSGAYSQGGAYDVHPYMLLNYNGKYEDVSTLAHELGHTMQSYYSNRTQPYPLANYPIFVAEVASTFNEALLIDYMLKTITDADARLSLLGSYLEGIKGTVFRQTQFAEFELRMHEMAQKGQPITGEGLDRLYLDITKKYYGHDKGVMVVDDYIAHEWAFIPHFYRDFYVFQYATSFTASSALAEKVKAGDGEATRRYLAFLSAGGSKYPIDLLKDAGVDMTADEPLELTLTAMTRVMDEMERLLGQRAR